jgi:hypothetical protein
MRRQGELSFVDLPADPRVLTLQETLFRGKREGTTELEGLGRFASPEIVGLADALLGKTHRRAGAVQERLR